MTFIENDQLFDPERPLMYQGPRLYLLMRTDIAQMNPGKLAAQAAHAATQFVFDVLDQDKSDSSVQALLKEMSIWREQGSGGFGTKITLAATETQIHEKLAVMNGRFGLQVGLVIDPTYPMTNYWGEPFVRKEMTGAYVFVPHTAPREVLEELKEFELHR